MSEKHTNTVIFESEAFTLSEFYCSGECVHKRHEEAAPEHEIVFPQKGYFQCRNSLGKTQGDPNRVLFFNKDQPYEIEHPLGGGDVCTVFSVSAFVLQDLIGEGLQGDDFHEHQPFGINHQSITPLTSLKHHTLVRTAKNLSGENILGFEEAVMSFLKSLFDQSGSLKKSYKAAAKKTTREARRELVNRTILFLNSNFQRNFTISRLAAEVYSSPFHLARVFHNETGLTLHGYISGLRLKTALRALREKSIPITELALDLGYSSHSHFSSKFKQSFFLSPKEYRNIQ